MLHADSVTCELKLEREEALGQYNDIGFVFYVVSGLFNT